ncbi:MAG: helix-turn-helix domain-containing protein [Candidatus Pacearchaeota archaeon]|jgi:sugar-specific transcriptional regulator TrmB
MEAKLIELLRSIGLSQNEIDVYLDLLKNHASTAYVVARRINQHRSGVYEAIRRLQQKGFIVEIQKENKKLYQTKEHTAIEEYLKQKQAELSEIAPYLKEVSNTEIPNGSISVSYGLTRLRASFSAIFDLKKEIFIWTLPKNVNEILGEWFLKEINETIIKKEIPAKIIYCEQFDAIKKINKNPFTQARHVDENTSMFTIVCSDIVILTVLADPITVIEMKNIDISEGFKSRFFTLWEKARVDI